MQSLPEHVKTVIDIRDAKHGNIILEQGELVNRQFKLNRTKRFQFRRCFTSISAVKSFAKLKNSIPESVTF